ncbi:Lar family restriction alleviation protein [Pseudomonas juntendi]|uniref:Lar family restriction alleviation protein n=1 Tax=Pseudomonas juntendi TaxID=2666183 RepID=UPI001FFD774A|nr:Lar family restriction alleviation protein [Pseudomonas juntendi]MCK2118533.1 Lar family restriction alleviation protein [Pseudomonas juntendi]
MPTENRSSNTEMGSELLPCPFCGEKPQITRHHREEIYSFMHRCPVLGPISWGFREDQQAHVEKWNARAQPTPQPHPEPIAWMVGTAIWWSKEEAERDAAAMGLPVVGLGPMAYSAEVERLRAALKFYADREHYHFESGNWDTVSGEPLNILWCGDEPDFIEDGTVARNALSASAEPSAPNDCAICRDLGDQCMECEESDFREWADRHFAAADYRKTDAGVFIQDWMRHAYGAWCARGALVRQS